MGKYEEALKRARAGKPLDEVFPELKKESKDEKIRKGISNAICGTTAEAVLEANGVKLVDALAYLEKQKEQRPAEWSEGEEKDIQEASDYLRDYANNDVQGGNSKLYVQSLADRIESLHPQPHWKPSEEQMKTLKSLPGLLRNFKLDTSAQMLEVLYEQLKLL